MIMIKSLNSLYEQYTEFSKYFKIISREPIFNSIDVTLTPSSELKTDYTSNLIITNNDNMIKVKKADYSDVEIQ